MNTSIAIGILAFWAVLATIMTIAALRARAKQRLLLVRTGNDLITTKAHLARAQEELRRLKSPTRDGSDGKLSMARALRTITGPVKPTSATPRRGPDNTSSRNDSTDALNAAIIGSTLIAPATDSCDTSSSSSYSDSGSSSSSYSSDGGSCGGGE